MEILLLVRHIPLVYLPAAVVVVAAALVAVVVEVHLDDGDGDDASSFLPAAAVVDVEEGGC